MTAGANGTPIIPRWEWRTFGESFGDAETRLASLPQERVQESDEVYLLSLASDASVKIRDALMDVKKLEQVSDGGLEQWRPVLKAPFPLSAADVALVLDALRVVRPSLDRATYSQRELIELVVDPSDELRAVSVHKHRERYSPNGCMAEVTEIRTGEGTIGTIAIESEDPTLVISTVYDLGLTSDQNTCLARGLKRLVDFGDEDRYAVVDVGTNSVKLHIAARGAGGTWTAIVDRSEITRLGEGLVNTGRLQPAPIERTADAIAGMAAEAAAAGVVSLAAVGTAGLRLATNRAVLIDEVHARCGIDIEVITGAEEARLAYVAATSGLDTGNGSLVVFETGGGSSQFTFGTGSSVEEQFSVDVGAVRMTERFGLDGVVSDEVLEHALAAIADELGALDDRPMPDALVGLGGALTNLAAVKHELATYDPRVVQGTVLDRSEVDRQIDLYRTRTASARRGIVGLQPARAEVILAGACVVRTVLEKLGRESLMVSDRGLRHGLLAERFGSPTRAARRRRTPSTS